MDTHFDAATALALLDWQIELGADEATGDMPVDRYALAEGAARGQAVAAAVKVPGAPVPEVVVDAPAVARRAAALARDLPSLAERMAAFDLCDLRRGARNFCFADGVPGARVMIVTEAPGREEDLQGRPMAGAAAQLLDRMLGAIGLSRSSAEAGSGVYITSVLPWRPPGNRMPEASEIAMFLPFLERHVELSAPEIVVLMGNAPCQALLGQAAVTRIRGEWVTVLGRPALPMFHPGFLLHNPLSKREAWADLLSLKARLLGAG